MEAKREELQTNYRKSYTERLPITSFVSPNIVREITPIRETAWGESEMKKQF
jgi:hypothetical protein